MNLCMLFIRLLQSIQKNNCKSNLCGEIQQNNILMSRTRIILNKANSFKREGYNIHAKSSCKAIKFHFGDKSRLGQKDDQKSFQYLTNHNQYFLPYIPSKSITQTPSKNDKYNSHHPKEQSFQLCFQPFPQEHYFLLVYLNPDSQNYQYQSQSQPRQHSLLLCIVWQLYQSEYYFQEHESHNHRWSQIIFHFFQHFFLFIIYIFDILTNCDIKEFKIKKKEQRI